MRDFKWQHLTVMKRFYENFDLFFYRVEDRFISKTHLDKTTHVKKDRNIPLNTNRQA